MRTRKIAMVFSLGLLLMKAQQPGKFALTIDTIMRGPGLVGYEPAQLRWSGDSRRIYFQWKQPSQTETAPFDTYVVERDGSGLRKLSDGEANLAPPAVGDISRDRRQIAYVRDGDIFVYDNTSGKTQQVTRTTDVEASPRFLRDGKRVSFNRAGNLYTISLATGLLEQWTDLRPFVAVPPGAPARGGRAGETAAVPPGVEPPKGTPSQEYLKKQQRDLIEAVRERASLREQEEARRKKENPRKPYLLQPRQSVQTLFLSPDEKYVTAIITEAPAALRNTVVPNFVTESAYTEDIPGRSNVGDTQVHARLAVISAQTGELKWVDPGWKDRDVQLFQPVWSEDGSKAVLTARSADNKDRWIMALDPAAAKTRVLASDHDSAWIGGPLNATGALGWLKNDREAYFVSERTGWAHLYAVSYDGGEPRALTSGKWEVTSVRQSLDKSRLYFTANRESLYEQQFYQLEEQGQVTRITSTPGKHSPIVSPDDGWIADVYSYTNKPPELYVQESRPAAEARKLTTSPVPEFLQYPWLDAPIVTFRARDGVAVPARLFKPPGVPPGGPGVVFVHGSGYLQNVDRKWSTYYREYMFAHVLMERGYVVIDLDYRGSAGHGRDWRTAVYEHMGGKDLDDVVDAAKYLVSAHGVNAGAIGVYGGSYGGFLTLMAMFTQPDVFAAGAALRPVTDWAMYNHGYTSDILNLPQSSPEAYRRSSPIYFAGGLKGALLICHGMVDTNVEFQDSVRLVQRLIELRKENWQLAVYPVENHGFVEPSSWADEYKRILALFEKNLKRAG